MCKVRSVRYQYCRPISPNFVLMRLIVQGTWLDDINNVANIGKGIEEDNFNWNRSINRNSVFLDRCNIMRLIRRSCYLRRDQNPIRYLHPDQA